MGKTAAYIPQLQIIELAREPVAVSGGIAAVGEEVIVVGIRHGAAHSGRVKGCTVEGDSHVGAVVVVADDVAFGLFHRDGGVGRGAAPEIADCQLLGIRIAAL